MFRSLSRPLALVAALWLGAGPAVVHAQSATAVPQLDLDKLTGTWYQIAKLPTKSEKKCITDETVLYALSDKRDTFQAGTFCIVKHGDHDNINNSGRMSKHRDGKLQLRKWILFHRPYWVLATDPDFHWALVGTPNHKQLWILSRTATLPPGQYEQLQNTAAAQGYPVAKLVLVHHPKDRVTLASPSANPNQIESPTPAPTQTGTPPASSSGTSPTP